MIRYVFLKGPPDALKGICARVAPGVEPEILWMTDKSSALDLAKVMSKQWGRIIVRCSDYNTNQFLEDITVVDGEIKANTVNTTQHKHNTCPKNQN